ncbi:MAG: hypothetical protein K8J31_26740 [Anaerolineae bacterium]|nr:hypothetical protein [Anaerolineae bacterium]
MANNYPEQPEPQSAEASSPETANAAETLPVPLDTVAAALDEEAKRETEFRPTGAFRFVLVLIAGYIIYFFLTYYEIVILRGGA